MSHMHITYEPTASLITQPPPPPAPSLNSQESTEALVSPSNVVRSPVFVLILTSAID